MEKIKIGNVEFKSRAVLAPMAGITDRAYRELCVEFGAAYCVSEMVSSKALSFNSKKSEELMEISDYERPCGIQIFGDDPKCMADAAVHSMENKPDIIDINMGCPAPKISSNGSGSALMKNPLLCGEIVKAVTSAVDVPVTVKIRKGWNNSAVNAVEVAKICEQAGAAAITIHGRTREQYYKPPVDYDIIKEVNNAVSIPVIANGDITSAKIAKEVMDYTGCQLVMVGRASLGNPWILSSEMIGPDGSRRMEDAWLQQYYPELDEGVYRILLHMCFHETPCEWMTNEPDKNEFYIAYEFSVESKASN